MRHRRLIVLALVLIVALIPSAAAAQDDRDDGLLIRIDGPVTVAQDDSVDLLVVISGDVTLDGNVTGAAILIDADTTINGTVDGDVIAFDGNLTLGPNALVTGDVAYNNTTYTEQPGATVQGTVRDDLGGNWNRDFARFMAWLSLASWVGTTILMLLVGIVFAGVGGRQLWDSAALITRRPLQSILSALLLWIVISVLAVILFVSVLGIPIALALVLILVAIWGLGYVVAGARIGAALLRRSPDSTTEQHPYAPVVLGIGVIQLIALIPVVVALIIAYTTSGNTEGFSALNTLALLIYWGIGAVIWFIGALGTGALTYYAWQSWQGRSARTVAPGNQATV